MGAFVILAGLPVSPLRPTAGEKSWNSRRGWDPVHLVIKLMSWDWGWEWREFFWQSLRRSKSLEECETFTVT